MSQNFITQMKYKIVLFTFLFFSITMLFGQNEQVTSYALNWKGVEKWYSSSSSIQVITFDGAIYSAENNLPHFSQKTLCNSASSYGVELKNPVYIPLTNEETALLPEKSLFSSEPKVVTSILKERGKSFFNINILPFVNREGKILKLQSFDLQTMKESKPQKVNKVVTHTYAESSVLTHGKFVKIKITESGIYKLTYEDLVSMGVNPANVHIFGYGGSVLEQDFSLSKIDDLPELAIYMNKGSDGVFNAGDYVLFYAQGTNKWTYEMAKSAFTHAGNPYSQYGYYFVSSDVGAGKKIEEKATVLPDSSTINVVEEFIDYQVYEKDKINLASSGKEFYGETFGDVISYSFPFDFPNPVSNSTMMACLDVAAASSSTSSFTLSLNNAQSKTLLVSAKTADNYTLAMAATGIYTFSSSQSNESTFSIAYSKPTSTSVGYLNYLEVNARRQLKMSGSAMQFQNIDYLGQSAYSKYQLSNANSNVQIWDITDLQNITKMPTTTLNSKITFVDSSNALKHYLAIDPTASTTFPKPEIVGVVPNQNLHGIAQADMVIITYPDFLSQAETLAQVHREKDNLTVEVVTTDQVYNEFSSGTPDATAYRWAVKMLYDRQLMLGATSGLPKYLLLFGRGSYDNRKLLSNSGDNLVLTYQTENSLVLTSSYVTDDYFTLLDDDEGADVTQGLMDVGVGRFPVATVQQAKNVVNKTIGYMNNQGKGNWKNQICFLADDGGNGDGNIHSMQADTIAASVAKKFPAYQVNKIYLDAYVQETTASGESYPAAKNRFLSLLNSGLFFLNFTGHAGPTGLTNESMLSLANVKALSNKHLPFFVGATCDFLQFDVSSISGGEQFLLNSEGGGIGILSSARPVYSSQNFVLDKLICENLFKKQNGVELRIGDVIAFAKNQIGEEINKRCYIYMGDPALRLNYPTTYNVFTSKINESSVLENDTLRALSVDTIQGYVADDNGVKVTGFNGTLHITIYDKVQRINTLNNHAESNGVLTYSDRPNVLFSGEAEVIDGVFSFSFMLPKDIKYNYGGGRINYYAQDNVNDFEAQGYCENFIIGGTDKSYIADSIGPIVRLFLNSEKFISGDKVNETPLFLANVTDIHGINTVGVGIGHDVMITIDKDPLQSYVLNDYFQSTLSSYTTGVIKYRLSELENGKHSLSFRVWDFLNNSTTDSIDFEVVKGLNPVIFSVNNYPNPAKTMTHIIVNHDRPETVLSTRVEVFDLSGRKIWSFSQSSADNISWDLTANNGRRVQTGIYLYRVSIKTADSDFSSKTNKMLIIEQ